MSDEIAIKVDGVSKSFKLPHERHSSIKGAIVNIGRTKRGYEKQHVLKNVSFEIKKGEFFGIVGRNGSGKSTLLKLLAGIYTPDKGTITVNGKLTPFIELGVGFNPELSGRENVFLNGALLGFNRKEMEAMYDEIVEFAELERFMDQKLKNYSSGMQVRLAFSIAIRANSDILVLDEVLAVGDANFQTKCLDYFSMLKRNKKTIILVTHDMSITEKFCDRAILIESGNIVFDGSAVETANKYNKINQKIKRSNIEQANNTKIKKLANVIQEIKIKNLWAEGKNNKKETIFGPNETLNIFCQIQSDVGMGKIAVIMKCNYPLGSMMFAINTQEKELKIISKTGESLIIEWQVPNIYNDGNYTLSAAVYSYDLSTKYDELIDCYDFEIRGWGWPQDAITHPRDKISITKL